MQFSVIVFDTAPTGHTLRFLSFPSVLEKALSKLSGLSGRFGPMLNQIGSMMGGGINTGEMLGKLEDMRAVVTEVNAQFKNPVRSSSHLRVMSIQDSRVGLETLTWSPRHFLSNTCETGFDDFRARHE